MVNYHNRVKSIIKDLRAQTQEPYKQNLHSISACFPVNGSEKDSHIIRGLFTIFYTMSELNLNMLETIYIGTSKNLPSRGCIPSGISTIKYNIPFRPIINHNPGKKKAFWQGHQVGQAASNCEMYYLGC